MRTLLVLRHAKSSWKHPALSDHDRPLNTRGRRDVPRVGAFVRDSRLAPDLIISSTATRARSTADEVARCCAYHGAVTLEPRLYLAEPSAIVDVVQGLGGDARTVLIVGHNPGVAGLVAQLTGQREEFPTAALAQIQLPIATWPELRGSTRGRLVNLWRAKDE